MNDIDLKQHIRSIPDFPKPGIMFRDITTLLAEPAAFREVVERFAVHFLDRGVTAIVAAEARGFIFAAPLALQLNAKFIPVRKPGKLPFETQSFSYELEYGSLPGLRTGMNFALSCSASGEIGRASCRERV